MSVIVCEQPFKEPILCKIHLTNFFPVTLCIMSVKPPERTIVHDLLLLLAAFFIQ